jgi:hypothetical protein
MVTAIVNAAKTFKMPRFRKSQQFQGGFHPKPQQPD